MQVIDMFSGCGGMSLGFASVGSRNKMFKLVGALDINETSLATYQRNFGVPAILGDIRCLAKSPPALNNFLGSLKGYSESCPTVLIGCAPCQGFTAHRKKNWDSPDPRNSLVGAFAQVAVRMMPDLVVMENVPELLSGRYWPYFEGFRKIMERAGYTVKAAIHNAAEFGTPQERFRALVVASRKINCLMPKPTLLRKDFVTVRDAIGELPPVKAGQVSVIDPYHRSAKHKESTLRVIQAVPPNGGSRPSGIGPACLSKIKGFYDVYGRLAWDKPAITITHYARNPASGRFVHPEQNRGLTMREAARLQGFPDAFEFLGGFDDIFRQIGEAVAPPFAAAVADSISQSFFNPDSIEDCEALVLAPVRDSFAGVIAGIKSRAR